MSVKWPYSFGLSISTSSFWSTVFGVDRIFQDHLAGDDWDDWENSLRKKKAGTSVSHSYDFSMT